MDSIWKGKKVSLEDLTLLSKNTMVDHLGIEFTELGPDYLQATMPVDQRTCQPYGILHGGASATLIETLGSIASALLIDTKKQYCVGISLNVSHIRSATGGKVTGIARPIHVGRTTHVWEVKIYKEDQKIVAAGRLTVAVLDQGKMKDQGKKYERQH